MIDYQKIAVELNRTFKDKVVSRLTGVRVDSLRRLRAGIIRRPLDVDAAAKLVDVHKTAKGIGWI